MMGLELIFASIVETGISIICCSMPAMAAFWRLQGPKAGVSTSLYRFVSGLLSTSRGSSNLASRTTSKAQSSLKPCIHNNAYVELEEGTRTEIEGAAFQGRQPVEGIQKSVSLEQSSKQRISARER